MPRIGIYKMTSNYITSLNAIIARETGEIPNGILFGENINNGSCIGGLTKNLEPKKGGRVINVGNCEYTHCGVGFGLMLNGVSSVLFAKQLDFMVLGMDHFVSTYQFIRCRKDFNSLGSFTIITIVCDQGFQGPQSSLNGLGDFCSLARVAGYTLNNTLDAEHILKSQLAKPGFRLITLSQRLFPTEIAAPELVYAAEDSSFFQYASGNDATIVCFNFSLPEGMILRKKLSDTGIQASLFSMNYTENQDLERIRASLSTSKKIIGLDDSKSLTSSSHQFLHHVARDIPGCKKMIVTRESNIEPGVSPDKFNVDYDKVIAQLKAP